MYNGISNLVFILMAIGMKLPDSWMKRFVGNLHPGIWQVFPPKKAWLVTSNNKGTGLKLNTRQATINRRQVQHTEQQRL
jgi:hypothetical protein